MPTLVSERDAEEGKEEEEEGIEITRLECLLIDEEEKNKHVKHHSRVTVT